MWSAVDFSPKLRGAVGGLALAIGLLAGTRQLIAHTPDETSAIAARANQQARSLMSGSSKSEGKRAIPRQAAASSAVCEEPGIVYLDAPGGVFAQNLLLEIESNFGIKQIFIPAGATVSTAAGIVYTDCHHMFVTAAVSDANSDRLEVYTTQTGESWFVAVRQVLPGAPIVYASPVGGMAMNEYTDFGCDGGAPCFEFATAFIDVGTTIVNGGDGAIGFEIFSDQGPAAYAFLSGSATMNIVDAINAFADEVGVVAKLYSPTGGIVLRSAFKSSTSYLSVHQINGNTPMLQVEPGVGETAFEVYDEGLDDYAGDTNHDDVIDTDDLTNVINDWRGCSDSQPCDGDLNGDNNVDVDDLLEVVNNWGIGECPKG